jgi:hypothetical protein
MGAARATGTPSGSMYGGDVFSPTMPRYEIPASKYRRNTQCLRRHVLANFVTDLYC